MKKLAEQNTLLCGHALVYFERSNFDYYGLAAFGDDVVDLGDDVIAEMLATDKAVIADICVDKLENCFPMIPSGAAHNEMLLGPADKAGQSVSEEGMVLV